MEKTGKNEGRLLWLTNNEMQAARLQMALHSLGEEVQGSVVRLEAGAPRPDLAAAAWVGVTLMGRQLPPEEIAGNLATYAGPLWCNGADDLPAERAVTGEQADRISRYLAAGGKDNYRALWRYLANEFQGKDLAVAEPLESVDDGLYYPGEPVYRDAASYCAAHVDPAKPTVGMLFLRDDWLWGETDCYDAMIAELEAAGMNVLPLFSHWGRMNRNTKRLDECFRHYFYLDGKPLPAVVINNHRMSLQLGRALEKNFLGKLGVPVLQAYHTKQELAVWEASPAGLTPTEVSATVAMIETDGILHGPLVSTRTTDEAGQPVRVPRAEGLRLLAEKARRWARLRELPNAEKKVAVILHNYPANNTNIGCAADLDSGESLLRILRALQAEGYTTGDLPATTAELWERVLAQVTNDRNYLTEELIARAPKISAAAVRDYVATLSPRVREDLRKYWGEAPGDVFATDDGLLLPGLVQGNIYIGLQPPRGFGEDPSAIIHSPTMPPTYHYLAYYHYLRDIWGADAFIHLGTHGSQEWLPGKQNALSNDCYSLLTMEAMPNLYPYLTTVVGEGIQAKRRGAAAVIGYLPAPTEESGLYGEWEALHPLLEEYAHFQVYNPSQTADVLAAIVEKIEALGMQETFGTPQEGAADDYVLAVHNFMHEMAHRQTHVGLHILGEAPSGDRLTALVYRLVQVAQGDVPALPEAIGDALGIPFTELAASKTKSGEECAAYERVLALSKQFVEALAAAEWVVRPPAELVAELPATETLATIVALICDEIVPRTWGVAQEMDHLLLGLRGGYIPPGPGGSPSSGNLAALPTGRNFYGIDPSLLPTRTAWRLGVALGDGLVNDFVLTEGRYPEQVGIVVWAGPNLRSNGQCLAEIMYLLGVRPRWDEASGRIRGLEILSPEELGRPRIDVTVRISGLVRDALPQAVTWLNRAVQAVADLDEPPELNYIRKHIAADSAELEAAGKDPETALREARYRVFGCPPGAYGAGVGGLLDERNWETDQDLAQVYVAWGGYAYNEQGEAQAVPDAFRRRLATLDATVKNEDTRDVNLMSSDDFNAYHGGMIAASRALGGKAPKAYVGDSSVRSRVQVRTLTEEFQTLMQTEALHPKYIAGMMEHGFKGAQELAKRAALAYGWDATSGVMNDALYGRVAESYLLDDKVREWLNEVNPWAAKSIAETLFEAAQRGFWQAPEEMLDTLRDMYLQTEGQLEERTEEEG